MGDNLRILKRAQEARSKYGDVLDKADALSDLEWILEDVLCEYFSEDEMPSRDEQDGWLADMLHAYEPDAWINWDNMGGGSSDPDGRNQYLRDLVHEAIGDRLSPYVCPDCKQPTSITVKGEVYVKLGRDGSEEPSDVEIYPENAATCDTCEHEAEKRAFERSRQ